MTMAKGIANGMLLANTMTTTEIARSTIEAGLTLSTLGGNPVSCEASLGVLQVLKDEADPSRIEDSGRPAAKWLGKFANQI